MKAISQRKIILIISAICATYFPLTLGLALLGADQFIIFGVLYELLTLPVIAAILVLFVISFIKVLKEKLSLRSEYFLCLLLLGPLIGLGLWLEFFQ